MTTETPQHMTALKKGNEVRFAGARLKSELKALDGVQSRRHLAHLLTDWESLPVQPAVTPQQLLKHIHRMGVTKANNLCNRVCVSPVRRISHMTERQRLLLAELLLEQANRLEAREGQAARGRRYGD